ncbi:MAG: pyridoxal phosphate-dependent aminotransferase [Clostridiales bacterium]|nr:pyridoxal phosphate-dependent aminotransferase [Clostridiales bacterium]
MELKKSTKLTNVRYDIRGPVAEEATRMEKQGIKVMRLNTGNPAAFGFKPPSFIPKIISENLQLTAAYSTSKGLISAREAIAGYCAKKGIENVEISKIFTGNGVSELITIALQALLNDGDEILIPAPDYPLWTAIVNLMGGKVVHYLCDEAANWYPDLDDIKRKITNKTKAIVIINPNNPTGAVYPEEILTEMCEIARRNKLVVFSDEIYDRLLMDNAVHVSFGKLAPDLPVITFNGLSKSHQLCGYRCGWLVASGDTAGMKDYLEGLNVLASMRLCSNVPSQTIIAAALENANFSKDLLLPGGRLYEQREFAFKGLNEIPGFSAVKSMAGLYMFPKMDTEMLGITDDEQFVLDFLREKHVLLTHGGTYNWSEPNHFRLVYLPEVDDLREVMVRLKDFAQSYSQRSGL